MNETNSVLLMDLCPSKRVQKFLNSWHTPILTVGDISEYTMREVLIMRGTGIVTLLDLLDILYKVNVTLEKGNKERGDILSYIGEKRLNELIKKGETRILKYHLLD